MSPARRWIVWLWAGAASLGAAGFDRELREVRERAAAREAFLLPENQMPAHRREDTAAGLAQAPEVARVVWLSPGDIVHQVGDALERERWPELFPQEEAWLPWIAAARFRDPIGRIDAVRSRLEIWRGDPLWRLVVFDLERLESDRLVAQRIAWAGSIVAVMLLAAGGRALRLGPSRRGSAAREAAVFVAGAWVWPAALGGTLAALNAPPDGRSWAVALGTGLLLAGFLAPVIQGRDAGIPHPGDLDGVPATVETIEDFHPREVAPAAREPETEPRVAASAPPPAPDRPQGGVFESSELEKLAASGASEAALAEHMAEEAESREERSSDEQR